MIMWLIIFVSSKHPLFGASKSTIWGADNPNTFMGVVGKVQKKRRKEGGEKSTRPRGSGLESGTYCVLGEGPQLHATGDV